MVPSSASYSAGSDILTLTSQPSPYASLLTMAGSASTASLNSRISPPMGRNASLTVFTASIEPNTSPAARVSPTVGTSTKTMSPNWLCAKSVMPITAVSPSTRHHSWSFEYFRFAGTFMVWLSFKIQMRFFHCKYNCYFRNSKDLCYIFNSITVRVSEVFGMS